MKDGYEHMRKRAFQFEGDTEPCLTVVPSSEDEVDIIEEDASKVLREHCHLCD